MGEDLLLKITHVAFGKSQVLTGCGSETTAPCHMGLPIGYSQHGNWSPSKVSRERERTAGGGGGEKGVGMKGGRERISQSLFIT